MFNPETRLEQARDVTRLIRDLADVVPVVLCSGNHDNAGRLVSYDRASVYEWFIDLGIHPNIITDGSTSPAMIMHILTHPVKAGPKNERSVLARATRSCLSGPAGTLATFPLCVGGKRRANRNANQNPQREVVDSDAEYQAQRNADSYRLSAHRVYLHAVGQAQHRGPGDTDRMSKRGDL